MDGVDVVEFVEECRVIPGPPFDASLTSTNGDDLGALAHELVEEMDHAMEANGGALGGEGHGVRAAVQLAMIARVTGDKDRAERMLRKLCRLQVDAEDAQGKDWVVGGLLTLAALVLEKIPALEEGGSGGREEAVGEIQSLVEEAGALWTPELGSGLQGDVLFLSALVLALHGEMDDARLRLESIVGPEGVDPGHVGASTLLAQIAGSPSPAVESESRIAKREARAAAREARQDARAARRAARAAAREPGADSEFRRNLDKLKASITADMQAMSVYSSQINAATQAYLEQAGAQAQDSLSQP